MSGYKDNNIIIIIILTLEVYTYIYCLQFNFTHISFKDINNIAKRSLYVPGENNLVDLCPRLKDDNILHIEKMADVWQTVYSASDRVPCFKMLIRKVGIEERKLNKEHYGSLGNDVLWDNCTLENKAKGNKAVRRRHFLQQTSTNHGILRNIIIEIGNTTKLVRERPDQWFVQKNLLIMRDCYTDLLVVFTRVPYQPNHDVIVDALDEFGRDVNGTWTCDDSVRSFRTDASY